MFEKEIVVDGKGHLLGRLASIVAKELLNGQRVVIVRCEGIMKSGSFFRNKVKFHEFLHLRTNHKPTKWIQHYRSPSRVTWRVIRGMLPHKTPRGALALGRIKVFEGVPSPYDKTKKMVIPNALKIVRMKNHRKFCKLGDICASVGWSKANLIDTLEEKRKARAKAFYEKKLARVNAQRESENLPPVKALKKQLEAFGY